MSKIRSRRGSSSRAAFFSTYAYRYYLMGRLHSLEERPQQAINAFKSALVYDAESAFLRYNIAQQFVKLNQLDKANFWAQQSLLVNAKYAPAFYLLGRIAWNRKQAKKATQLFYKAVQASPRFADAYLALYRALLQDSKNIRKQKNVLLRMIRHLPGRFEGHFYLANLVHNQGKIEKSIRHYKDALNLNPSHQPSLFQLAKLYEQQKRWKEAIRTYQVLLDYQPNAWQMRISLACLYLQRNQAHDSEMANYQFRYIMREADRFLPSERAYQIGTGLYQCNLLTPSIAWLKKAIRAQANFAAAHLALGVVFAKANRLSEAVRHFRAVSPKDKALYIEAQTQLLSALLQMGRVQPAWLALERARLQLSRQPDEWIRLSQLFVERAPLRALPQEAQQILAHMNQLPNHKGLLHLLAFLFFKQQKYLDAEKLLQRIIKRDPKHATSLNFLGYLYAVLGKQLQQAEQLVQRALRIDPDNAYFFDSLGWIYFRQGKLMRAQRTLEKALRLLPQDTTILLHLARIYERQGQWRRALHTFKKAQQLQPPPQLKREINAALKQLIRRISLRKSRKHRNHRLAQP